MLGKGGNWVLMESDNFNKWGRLWDDILDLRNCDLCYIGGEFSWFL